MHVADVITAIGKLKALKMTPAQIAGALGYAELEVRGCSASPDCRRPLSRRSRRGV